MAASRFAWCSFLLFVTFPSFLRSTYVLESDSTLEELLRSTDVHRLVSQWTNAANRAKSDERSLEGVASCGEILTSWTKDEAVANLSNVINESLEGLEAILLTGALSVAAKNGVQVRKLCASCTNVQAAPPNFDNFCGADDYGFDVQHSGLVFLPLAADATSILPGTHKSIVYCVGTRTGSQPSTEWEGTNSGIEIFLNVALTITTGSAIVIPDYMGQGESQGKTFRGYIVRKSYATSAIPLWLATNELVRTETDCASSLASSVATLGYSEGGYASVAVADALSAIGADLIRVEAGGAPFRLSTVATLSSIANVDDGSFPSGRRQYFGLVGSSYSSTYRDVDNYQRDQDMLSEETRGSIVDLVATGASGTAIKAAIPVDDPISIFDAELVAWVRDAIQRQDPDPCNNNPQPGVSDLICLAFQDNSLTDILHTARYPIRLCHSPDDAVIDIGNLPEFSQNSNLSFLQVSGSHGAAGETCVQESLTYFLSDDFQDYPVADTHIEGGGCPVENRPTFAPSLETPVPTETPNNANRDTPTTAPAPASSIKPTASQSDDPSQTQSNVSSEAPSVIPSGLPSVSPSRFPVVFVSSRPSGVPSDSASEVPESVPSDVPSPVPVALIVGSESPIQESSGNTDTPTSPPNPAFSQRDPSSSVGRILAAPFCLVVPFMVNIVYAAFI